MILLLGGGRPNDLKKHPLIISLTAGGQNSTTYVIVTSCTFVKLKDYFFLVSISYKSFRKIDASVLAKNASNGPTFG